MHRPGQARASGGINVTAHQSDGVNELRQAPKVIHVQMRDEDASHARDRDAVAIQRRRDWLAAVEEIRRRAVQQGDRGVAARGCGKRTAGPEDHKLAHKHHYPHANGLLAVSLAARPARGPTQGRSLLPPLLAQPRTEPSYAAVTTPGVAPPISSGLCEPLSLAGRRRLKVGPAAAQGQPLRRAVVHDRILRACWEVGS